MKGLWDYSKLKSPTPYGEATTYRKGMEFLDDCEVVEDWGCGPAFAKMFRKRGTYIGIDGSTSAFVDRIEDLREYRSQPDGIFIRHVLEHNFEWRKILDNVMASFRRKLALIMFTPFAPQTKQIATNWSNIPDLSFRKEDITDAFTGMTWREEVFATDSQYKKESVFYVERGTASQSKPGWDFSSPNLR